MSLVLNVFLRVFGLNVKHLTYTHSWKKAGSYDPESRTFFDQNSEILGKIRKFEAIRKFCRFHYVVG